MEFKIVINEDKYKTKLKQENMKLLLLFLTLTLFACEAPKKFSAYPKTPKKNYYSPSHN
jgi:hypothetical protein